MQTKASISAKQAVLAAPIRRNSGRKSLHVVNFKTEEWRESHQDLFERLARKGTKYQGYAAIEPNKPLKVWNYEPGEMKEDEVEIRVTHNGLCHTDIHMKDNDWGVSGYPFIPGHEVVGFVTKVGAEVKGLEVGDRVGYAWIKNSCRKCGNCLRGEENICENGYSGLIVLGGLGGFQHTLRAPGAFAFKIPDTMPSEDAAPLMCAGITVYAPLRKWITRPGMKVAVMGIGGLGHLALQFAAHMGAEVTAIGSKPGKEAESKSFGAHHFVPWTECSKDSKYNGKYDIILNCSPVNSDNVRLMQMLHVDGTLIQTGIPGGGAMITVPLQDVVFGQKKLVGSIVGGRADMQEMLNFACVKGVKPKVETMPLSKVNEAMQYVLDGKARYRVVLVDDEVVEPNGN
jgi:uncharacterized zinc-type alcohol dehydrogenase-like protein